MARATKKQLRATWLQVHKWIGLTLAVLIIPISLTGSALVWHDWLDAKLEPQRHAGYGEARSRHPAAMRTAAKAAIGPGQRISTIRFEGDGGPVVATATKIGGSRWLCPARADQPLAQSHRRAG